MLTLSKEGEKLNIMVLEQVRGGAGFCGKNLCYDGCGTGDNDTDYFYSVDYKIWWATPFGRP